LAALFEIIIQSSIDNFRRKNSGIVLIGHSLLKRCISGSWLIILLENVHVLQLKICRQYVMLLLRTLGIMLRLFFFVRSSHLSSDHWLFLV
jgi:hypothetical protein